MSGGPGEIPELFHFRLAQHLARLASAQRLNTHRDTFIWNVEADIELIHAPRITYLQMAPTRLTYVSLYALSM